MKLDIGIRHNQTGDTLENPKIVFKNECATLLDGTHRTYL